MHLLTVVTLLIFFALTTCSDLQKTKETPVSLSVQSKILYVNIGDKPDTLDPHKTTSVNADKVISALYTGLTIKNGKTLDPEPSLAERWEVSKDKLTYIFHLRRNVLWSNSRKLEVEHILYSWKRLLDPKLRSANAQILFSVVNAEAYNKGQVDFSEVGIKILDSQTIEVKLNRPTPYFLMQLSQTGAAIIFPENYSIAEINSDISDSSIAPNRLVTNGPFIIASQKSNEIRLVRSATYFDKERIKVKAVQILMIPDQKKEERLYEEGRLHITADLQVSRLEILRNKFFDQVESIAELSTEFIEINTRKDVLKSVLVRRALAKSIDRDQVANFLFKGHIDKALTVIPSSFYGFKNSKSSLTFEPEVAKKLLSMAGFPNGKGFPVLRFIYNSHETHHIMAVLLKSMWKINLNIDVQLEQKSWGEYLDHLDSKDFDLIRSGWSADFPDVFAFSSFFLSNNLFNATGWADPRYDKLIEVAENSDRDIRIQLTKKAQELMLDQAPIIPIYFNKIHRMVHPFVKNLANNSFGYLNVFRDVELSYLNFDDD